MNTESRFSLVDVELPNGSHGKGLAENAPLAPSPIVVDFLSPKLRHRLKNGADGEAIVKAVGVKRSERPRKLVYDFTAGLGTEAFLLASAGFRVIAFERNESIFQLLEDGLRRYFAANEDSETKRKIDLTVIHADATAYFSEPRERAYAVTLDPMFEGDATEGKSRPKKEMAGLRKFLKPSSDTELQALFDRALETAEARVIVKRPQGAPDLVSVDKTGRRVSPAHRLEGKTARFDIYSCR